MTSLPFVAGLSILPDDVPADGKSANKPVQRRVTSANAALKVVQEMRRKDQTRAGNRARVQAMFDGEPPFRPEDLAATGQGGKSNLNFDEAGAALEHSMSGYVDLFTSTRTFMGVKLRYGSYPAPIKQDKETKISEAFTRLLRRWPSFYQRFLLNCHHFVTEGVSVCYFTDTYDFRWQVAKFGEFYIPDGTKADPDSLDQAGGIQRYRVTELYGKIRSEEVAKTLGWDVDAIKKLLLQVGKTVSYPGKVGNQVDWESLQVSIKNNDAFWSSCTPELTIAHLWVKEFSGKWSHYMMNFDSGETAAEFIYKREDKFPENRMPFFIFTYGLGSNGYYHGIRGLGWKIYPHVQLSNRVRNQTADGVMLSNSLLLQPTSEDDLNSLALTYYGPYAVLPPGHKTVDSRIMPNVSQNAMPLIQDMAQMLRSKTGQYSSLGMFADGKERSRFEVEAEVAIRSKLSITSLNLFYEPQEMLLREVLRRVMNPHYGVNMPGGVFVVEMKKRLHVLGITSEDLKQIDYDECVVIRAVGGGSAEARQATLNTLAQMAPAMDDVGRSNLLLDRVANLLGDYEAAQRYVPGTPEARTTVEDKLALMENGQFEGGLMLPVLPHELHLVHLKLHVGKLTELNTAVNEGKIAIADVLETMTLLHAHSTQHIEAGGQDPYATEAYAFYRQALQHIGGTIWNGHKEVQAAAAKAQQEGGAEGGDPGGLSPQLVKMLNEHNVKLRLMSETHQLKMQQQQAMFAAKLAQQDALTAAKI